MIKVKFLVDAMVGKLSKWLRIMGYDTIYFHNTKDKDLLKTAVDEERILVTRNSKYLEPNNTIVFIRSDKIDEQLRQIVSELNLDWEAEIFTRCILCNRELKKVEKDAVKDKVPPYVFKTQENFSLCEAWAVS
ncbi:MAG: Mut7-C RNAse domain-containing protein [Firmicutes bacterium]|nr:Mut7-C RNAse domain-containing protein [Bacillota bacterium]